jgi:hypothetical protein
MTGFATYGDTGRSTLDLGNRMNRTNLNTTGASYLRLQEADVIVRISNLVKFEVYTPVAMKNDFFWGIKTQFVLYRKP